jgi:hypothetical protein
MIQRRDFITVLGGAAAWPLAVLAQQGNRVRRIGVLLSVDENDPVAKTNVSAFTQALAALGWTDGRNLRMDLRWYGDDINRLRALAQELVGLRPDIIVTGSTPPTARVTGDIPQNVNFALKVELARTFLESKGISYRSARSDRDLSSADVGEIARPSTVYIACQHKATVASKASIASTASSTGPPKLPTFPQQNRIEAPKLNVMKVGRLKEATNFCKELYSDTRLDPIRRIVAIDAAPTLVQQSNSNFIANEERPALDAYKELFQKCRSKFAEMSPQNLEGNDADSTRQAQLRRREDVLDAEVILEHVAPFAGRQLPERRDHDTVEGSAPRETRRHPGLVRKLFPITGDVHHLENHTARSMGLNLTTDELATFTLPARLGIGPTENQSRANRATALTEGKHMDGSMNDNSRKERPNADTRDDKGRFGPGNPGRPRGARNRATVAAERILDDGIGAVAEKCIELAKEGNMTAISAVLRLRIPAQRLIELPKLETAKDGLAALRIITEAVARGEVDGDHGRALAAIVEGFLKSFEVVDLDARIRALEALHSKEHHREAA